MALRPDVGVQKQYRKKKPPKTYRYDASLSPELEWDEHPARERGEALVRRIIDAGSLDEAKAADDVIRTSLPHRSAEEARGIAGSFVGVTTWQAVCDAFGVDRAILADGCLASASQYP